MRTSDSPTPSARSALPLQYDGTAAGLGAILLQTAGLSLLTAGIYSFWGRSRQRRYLWHHLRVGEDRLAYTGNGRALLLHFLRGCVLWAGLGLVGAGLLRAGAAGAVLWGVLLLPALHMCAFSTRRQRMAHTQLRNVALGVRPKMGQYVLLAGVGSLLSLLTLGALWPLALNDRYDFLVSHSTWGNKSLRYTGRGAHMLRICWRGALWAVLSLGLYVPWIVAEVRRYRGKHTFIDEAHFLVTVTGAQLLGLGLSNLLLVLCTAGLGLPWARQRSLALQARTTQLKGYIDFTTVGRTAAEAARVLDALDPPTSTIFRLPP